MLNIDDVDSNFTSLEREHFLLFSAVVEETRKKLLPKRAVI